MKSYVDIIHSWVSNKRYFIDKEKFLVEFFKNGFRYTSIPEKVYFGANESAISFIRGGIYLIACNKDDGFWILQDTIHQDLDIQEISVKSIKNYVAPLYWLNFYNVDVLQSINGNVNVWESYKRASEIINNTSHGKFTHSNLIKKKSLLTSFWQYGDNTYKTLEDINNDLEENIKLSQKLSNLERQNRLKTALKFPQKTKVTTDAYLRNPDVIAETLERADGSCEICNSVAPFIRAKDRTPYLEVHHIVSLSSGGEDTIENTKALCPNCHRKQHYGI